MATAVNAGKNSEKMLRWEGLNYVKKVTTSKLSERTGFTPKFLRNWHIPSRSCHQIPWDSGGRRGLPENWKTITLLSSDQWQIWRRGSVFGGLIPFCGERNRNCSSSASGNPSANPPFPSTPSTSVKQNSWALKHVSWGLPNTAGFGNLRHFYCT